MCVQKGASYLSAWKGRGGSVTHQFHLQSLDLLPQPVTRPPIRTVPKQVSSRVPPQPPNQPVRRFLSEFHLQILQVRRQGELRAAARNLHPGKGAGKREAGSLVSAAGSGRSLPQPSSWAFELKGSAWQGVPPRSSGRVGGSSVGSTLIKSEPLRGPRPISRLRSLPSGSALQAGFLFPTPPSGGASLGI